MKIAGAGLSGSLLAYLLARDGEDVEVWERRKRGDVKPCGGGILRRTWKLLESIGIEGVEINRVVMDYPGGHLEIEGKGLAISADMKDLVEKLREMAESEGARIHFGKGITSGFDVDARGARSAEVLGMEGEGKGEMEDALYFKVLDFKPPVKYLWVFPKPYGYSVGVAGPSSWVVAHGEKYLRELGARKWRVHPIPIFRGNYSLESFLTGDAASLVDPLNYEGISGAVISSIAIWKRMRGESPDLSELIKFLRWELWIYRRLGSKAFRRFFLRKPLLSFWLKKVYSEFSPRTVSSLRI